MSKKSEAFTKHNAEHAIVSAEILTSKKKRMRNEADIKDASFTRYKFENGTVRTLSVVENKALKVKPRWKGIPIV